MRRSRPKPSTVQVHPHLVDRLMELYCDWRTACSAVRTAYEQFAAADDRDRALAHAAYSAALDREGSAADEYAAQISLIRSRVPGPALGAGA
jgi:hypothetical protein